MKMIKNKKELLKNPDFARVVADITGDGHLQIQGYRYLTSFFSKHFEEIETIKKRFFNLFGVEGRIYIDNSKSKLCKNSSRRYKIFFISKEVALFLRDVGVPVGNKTNNRFEVPKFIWNGSNKLKSAYLRGLFDNEGTIFHRKNGNRIRWQISFKMAKNSLMVDFGINYFEQIRTMLRDFKVKSSPIRRFKLNTRKDGSKSIYLQMDIERTSFKNFFKYVGFEHPEKKKRLLFSLSVSG